MKEPTLNAYSQSILTITPILHWLGSILKEHAKIVIEHIRTQRQQHTALVLNLHLLAYTYLCTSLLHYTRSHPHYLLVLLLSGSRHILQLLLVLLGDLKSRQR
jgi:hypothetical protein